ncbi:autotransporter outer membrane beta-barrel domain-containing protein [Bordetella bronchialis]|nr:autotransporter domain-containing protein [Bordetella bronchialis]
MQKSKQALAPATLAAAIASVMASFSAQAVSPPVVIGSGVTDTTRRTIQGTDSVIVESGGTIDTSGTTLTIDSAVPAQGVSITNSGTIKSGNRGIDTSGSTAGSPFNFTLTNNAGGIITTGDDGIRVNSDVPVGRIVVENAGTITSQSGQAIDFDKINTAGNVIINNRAGGLIQAKDADAVRPGEGGQVNNWGAIVSSAPANTSGDPDDDPSNDGVDMQGHAAAVHNYAGGLISGARHGITSDVNVDVINEAGGAIVGRNGSGVGSDGDGTVVNHGTIIGAIDSTSVNGDGDGVDIDGKADIANTGTIQGAGAKGEKDGSPNNSEGIAAGGGSIRNLTARSLISGQANGILIDDSAEGAAPHATTLVNEGTIRGVTGFGVKIVGNQADTVTNAGLIEGGNGLALDLGGGNDTLNILTGSRIVGLVDGGAGNDTVNLIGSGTFAGGVNFENLTVRGGSWVLTGNQQYANGVTVDQGGSLDVQGTLAGTLTIGQGALLNGNGTLGSVNVAGTIAPGHSIGTLTFTGNYAQSAGSTYQAEIASGGVSDLIKVSGSASLAGNVIVTPLPGTQITPGLRYTILSAGQGVNGTYGSASSATQMLFLQPALSYDPNNVYLAFDRNATRYADVARTGNQRAAARGADSQPSGQLVHDTIALMNDPRDVRTAFDSLSGEIHASLKTSLLEDSHFARDAINDRLRASFADNAAEPPRVAGADGAATPLPASGRPAMWAQVHGAWGDIDGNGNAAKLERSIGGFMVGADFPLASRWRAGVAAGYDRTDLSIDGRSSSADVDSYTLAAYAGTRFGALGLRFGAANTWHRIDTQRDVAFAGFAGATNEASYDGNTAQIFGEAGYTLQYGAATFEPYAGLAYAHLHTQGFDEGGDTGLSGRRDNTGVTYTTLGLRATKAVEAGGTTALLHAMLGWRHAFGDTTPTATQSLPGGSPFTVSGVPIAKDAAILQAGLNVQVAKNVRVDLSYQGQLGDGVRQNGVMANVKVRF